MKARDLAALAALGVVGYEAYNKFGKKGEKPSTKAKAKEASEDTFRSDAGMRPDAEMRPTAVKASRQENDIPEALSRQERDVPDRIMGRDAAGSRFTGRDVAETPVAVTSPVPTRSVKPVAVSEVSAAPTVSDATAPTFSSSEEGMKKYVPRRPGQTSAAAPTFSSSEEGMKNYVPRRTGQTPSAVQQTLKLAAPVAPAATQNRYTKDQYGNIIDNVTGKVSRTIFSAGQEGNAARVGMKRGGAVKKMASGGLTSSRMSAKPKSSTASSRGDGIAQRGKTRGMMR